MMKAVVVEDEIMAARNLQALLNDTGAVEVIAQLESIAETIDWFSHNQQPDLLFLDIHLADGSAFEIFDRIKILCPIIFTTAYDEYALKAFKVNSIDYLLKPIDINAVQRALNKLKVLSEGSTNHNDIQKLISAFKNAAIHKTHFLVPVKGDKFIPLNAKDIACIFIENGLVKARTFNGNNFIIDYTLDELDNMLDSNDFFRANRQFIISRNAIKDIDIWFNSRLSINLIVSFPEKILVSKARVPEFKNWFSGK
jgi:DNA-binding LytR/AlgR family response regulator